MTIVVLLSLLSKEIWGKKKIKAHAEVPYIVPEYCQLSGEGVIHVFTIHPKY